MASDLYKGPDTMHGLMAWHMLKNKWVCRGSGPYNACKKALAGEVLAESDKKTMEKIFWSNERLIKRMPLSQIDMNEIWN